MRLWVVLIGAVVLVGAATACGGDEAAEPTTTSRAEAESTTSTTAATTSTSEVRTTPTSHPPDTVEGQVEQAYLDAWGVYLEALATADATGLDSAFAEEALRYKTEDVQYLVDNDLIARGDVEHAYVVAPLSETRAVVNDIWTSHLRDVNPANDQPVEPDPDEQRGTSFLLELREDEWVVIDINAI